jgi:hypothetical protein
MDKLDRRRSDLAHCCSDYEQDVHSDIQDAVLPDDEPRDRWHGASREWVEKQRISCFDQRHPSYRVQLQQLEWERQRILLWDE